MDCKDILRIVRGNAFTLCLKVRACRPDGSVIEDFVLDTDAVLKVVHGDAEEKEFSVVDNDAYVAFDDTLSLGWYGLEMTGTFNGEPWRWYVPQVFQIVENNAQANLPVWSFMADDTYIVGCGITLLSSMVQADWTESNPSNPSYILNKPDLDVYATHAEVAVVNNRIITLDGQVVKTVAQTLSDSEKQRARTNIGTVAKAYVDSGLSTKQYVIADLSTIRTGAADGTVARGYLYDFSAATHTPAEAVGTVLATVATKANGAQPKLTPGTGITIDENNVINATDGGGSSDAVLYTPQTLTTEQQTQARSNISAYTKPSGGIPKSDMTTAVQTSLGKADSALQDESVFVAEYGVTTAAQIQAAQSAGKYIFCTYNNGMYSMISSSSTWMYFGLINNTQSQTLTLRCSDSQWTAANRSLEQTSNKKTTITGNESSDTYYPSTKAVADYVSGIVGDINTILDEINGEVI